MFVLDGLAANANLFEGLGNALSRRCRGHGDLLIPSGDPKPASDEVGMFQDPSEEWLFRGMSR